MPTHITIWNEFIHEKSNSLVQKHYPQGIHTVIAAGLRKQLGEAATIRTATLDEPEHGLTQRVLDETDVLLWWGHAAHGRVSDEVTHRVHQRVLQGMGLVVLHSAHLSKPFVKLMGTSCMLRWREAGEKERIWIVNPSHPICDGFDNEYFELPNTEMYGEFFDIPQPDDLLFISWFEGGEVFRSGCTFTRGKGKIFYFRPGHETFPIYHDANVQRVIANGVKWATPSGSKYFGNGRKIAPSLSPIATKWEVDEGLHEEK